MTRHSPLDDPQIAAHAWARFKRLMRWMFGVTVRMHVLFPLFILVMWLRVAMDKD